MAVGKFILGIILVIIGLWLLIPTSWCVGYEQWCLGLWQELWFVIKGVVPILLVFFGAILVWIESEELKMSKPRKRRR